MNGELRVFQGIACPYGGGLPNGQYYLQPYNGQQGYLDYNMISNIVLVAQGQYGQAVISIPYAFTFQSNVCGFQGMDMNRGI